MCLATATTTAFKSGVLKNDYELCLHLLDNKIMDQQKLSDENTGRQRDKHIFTLNECLWK